MDNFKQDKPEMSEAARRFDKDMEDAFFDTIARIPSRERKKRTRDLLADEVVLQRLSKMIVLNGFRNRLEMIHAGTSPSSKTGDGTDIKVVSPYGEIAWNKLSRISDEEMKQLNKGAVDFVYKFLGNLLEGNLWSLLEDLQKRDPLPNWDAPNKNHP